jgi:hypothetical protein
LLPRIRFGTVLYPHEDPERSRVMAGGKTFKRDQKRRKEMARKLKQEEKMKKRLARKDDKKSLDDLIEPGSEVEGEGEGEGADDDDNEESAEQELK